ncbi:Fis family transcriptional regulator [Bacillus sp. AFS002410]|uniref:sigma factor-like helix-turn-helix DNA-binding protein n=1 Tax=Bacillus sp. AFS002410 TaxID=2033481 RepID=UPI000BF04EC7|nr:sigma factor-like helix-turn-helix DNA-binding protein [Bacillus sp. AFS002410]PEJ57415.1 Fis family transcriptional regulator [Bacillus sp. AFS002410]
MIELIKQYKETRKELINLLDNLKFKKNPSETDLHDKKRISEMISNLDYSIEWMSTGKKPGNKRGIERRAAYQKERPFDPITMQKYFKAKDPMYEWEVEEKHHTLSTWDKQCLSEALDCLTDKELETYMMSRGHCLPFEKIAEYLDISVGTVKKRIARAENKISRRKEESLFCLIS